MTIRTEPGRGRRGAARVGAFLAILTIAGTFFIHGASLQREGVAEARTDQQAAGTRTVGGQLAQSSNEGATADGLDGKKFEDWTIRCQTSESGEIVGCEAVQRLTVRDTGQRFLELAIGFPQGQENPMAVFVLPLGLWLPQGLVFQVDEGEARQTAIQRCIQGGCLVQIPLSGEIYSELRAGEQLAIQVYRQKDDPIAVPISLIGFTAAIRALQEQRAE